jgi:hypothetical protein
VIVKQVLADWEASGFSQFTTGNPLDPACNTNQAGVNNTDPSLSGVAVRCELTGEPIFSGYTPDTSVPYAFQAHFNLNAFRRPQPNGASETWATRRSACCATRRGGITTSRWRAASRSPWRDAREPARAVQLYNVFNLIEYTQMAATYTFSATGKPTRNTGKYNRRQQSRSTAASRSGSTLAGAPERVNVAAAKSALLGMTNPGRISRCDRGFFLCAVASRSTSQFCTIPHRCY